MTSILMLILLGLQTNYTLFYELVFKLNQDVLAETVCEKKTETCNACCYLDKQIQKESEPENNPALPEKERKNTEIKIQEYIISGFEIKDNNSIPYFQLFTEKFNLQNPSGRSLDHPPEILSLV